MWESCGTASRDLLLVWRSLPYPVPGFLRGARLEGRRVGGHGAMLDSGTTGTLAASSMAAWRFRAPTGFMEWMNTCLPRSAPAGARSSCSYAPPSRHAALRHVT